MSRLALALLVSTTLAVSLQERPQSPRERPGFRSETYGCSFDPPEFAADDDAAAVQFATFLAPPVDGFAANLSVQRQRFAGSLEDYRKLSEGQIAAAGWKLLEAKTGTLGERPCLELASEAVLEGRKLQFHSLAVKRGEFVFLLTCTAPAETFADHEQAFRDSLASFRFDR